MGRIRRFDGARIYNERWDGPCRDLFFYLVGVEADNFGLLRENAGKFAAAIGLSPAKVRERLELLVGEEVLLRYDVGADSYCCFTKWQDYQRLRFPGTPTCPIPPPPVFAHLSGDTRELFATYGGEAAAAVLRVVAVAVDVAVDGTLKGTAVPHKSATNYFLERLRKKHGMEEPDFPLARSMAFFAKRVSKGDTAQDFKDTIDQFFDDYIRSKSAARFSHFQSVYNELAAEVLEKRDKKDAKQ